MARFRVQDGTPPDWQAMCQVDVERVDGHVLSSVVDTLAFSTATPTELRRVGFDVVGRFVRLLQLSVEYLLHVQEALRNQVREEREARQKADLRVRDLEERLERLAADRDSEARKAHDFKKLAHTLAARGR
ncbi:hypothetical protein CTAYLR_003438 [Chrysophaeum taylorii]|uniref:Cilium assembly protein DZIP1 N-terminal domain-containing protein n=1 Tax=Chrysophaeum taylorii TaxID=2483200 RepID=A0AAD7U7R4_9STRA|nr:hypothetical protein CTAYLR_003438 [Chrysophaeum taylorii]